MHNFIISSIGRFYKSAEQQFRKLFKVLVTNIKFLGPKKNMFYKPKYADISYFADEIRV